MRGMQQVPFVCEYDFDLRLGDIKNHLFARGDGDGIVRLWDIRNIEKHQAASVAIHNPTISPALMFPYCS